MWFKKEQKRVCGGNCYGGNKGVLPEEGKSPVIAPKPQPKTLGKELREIATPIHEEYMEKLKKMREIREDQYKHYAEIVFNNTKEQLREEANNGRFRYTVSEEDVKNILKDKGFGGVDIDDLVEVLSELGRTMGIGVSSKEYLKDLVYEDGERKEDEYETWVIFEW
ncbi:hypothetical protein [Ligilactobacillus salivarius]|uniref:Uncharacterized protein n=1 Tax=Ligilactobacillus salivarius TaxID=1624 RepID=A0A089QF55_9LACO|nr:hypothetical protein [Ligilactobacillus salivarius]AIR11704.1 Hypothetical protein LSJ_3087c [Ligilactobacillus salivarius]